MPSSIFAPPSSRGPVGKLRIEYDTQGLRKRLLNFLALHSPGYFWNATFQRAIGWKRLQIEKGHHRAPIGLAHSAGTIHIRLNDTARYMDGAIPTSSLGDQEDYTPVGTLAHEIGHQFMWSVQNDQAGLVLWNQYAALKKRDAVSQYGATNPIEDFAEAYRLYALNPKLLARLSSNRFDIIQAMTDVLESKSGFKQPTNRQPASLQFALTSLEDLLGADGLDISERRP